MWLRHMALHFWVPLLILTPTRGETFGKLLSLYCFSYFGCKTQLTTRQKRLSWDCRKDSFFLFLATLSSMKDLSSPTTDLTHALRGRSTGS